MIMEHEHCCRKGQEKGPSINLVVSACGKLPFADKGHEKRCRLNAKRGDERECGLTH